MSATQVNGCYRGRQRDHSDCLCGSYGVIDDGSSVEDNWLIAGGIECSYYFVRSTDLLRDLPRVEIKDLYSFLGVRTLPVGAAAQCAGVVGPIEPLARRVADLESELESVLEAHGLSELDDADE
jgi:hypothetical protein